VPEPSLNWPLPDRLDIEERLIEAYSAGRGYHDLRHLTEVLSRLDELGVGGDPELVLAAWFHDAVYDDSGDNEARSAELAKAELAGSGVDIAEITRLVRLTEHHDPAPTDRRGEALCDADLAILAADPDRYAEYVAGVRREYAAMDETTFRAGRAAVLRRLLDRPALFTTDVARQWWELPARDNLARELDSLA
jgi:predicted metal-dependent HD superfamily phosphohydrolase